MTVHSSVACRDTNKKYVSKVLSLGGALIFGVCTSSLASAQCNTGAYGTNYSDTWMVGIDQPTQTTNADGQTEISLNGTPSVNVHGYGAYDEQYNGCGHEAYVDVSLSSPGGRLVSGSAGGGSYAGAEVMLPLLDDDLGDYFTSHSATVFCPIASRFFDGGGSISSRSIGISFSVYEKVLDQGPTRAIYQVIRPCNTQCIRGGNSGNFVFLGPPLPPYFVIGTPFFRIAGFVVCENAIRTFASSPARVGCGDLGLF